MAQEQTIKKCPQCGYKSSGKNRSNPQNRYYWGVCIALLSEHTGYTTDEIHEVLKHKFLKRVLRMLNLKQKNVEEVSITESTSNLDTIQFEEYLSQVRIWASQLGCYLPEPHEEIKKA